MQIPSMQILNQCKKNGKNMYKNNEINCIFNNNQRRNIHNTNRHVNISCKLGNERRKFSVKIYLEHILCMDI